MSIEVSPNHEAMSRQAAARIQARLAHKPDLWLCAAGGSTPLRTYDLLAEQQQHNATPFRSLRLVKLDEWGGWAVDDPGSCEAQMRSHLLLPLKIDPKRYLGFKGDSANPENECEKIRNRLETEGPVDLCILGLGLNGHVGMNEPGSALQPYAHVAQLTNISLQHSMLAEAKSKPAYGLTLGMAEILASREILLLVSGSSKRQPLQRLLRREITTDFPASLLWLHPRWTLLCDQTAAEGLNLAP